MRQKVFLLLFEFFIIKIEGFTHISKCRVIKSLCELLILGGNLHGNRQSKMV